MPSLEVLKLPYNYISSADCFRLGPARLSSLDLRDNSISGIDELKFLESLTRLKSLRLSDAGASRPGNPMCVQPGFVAALLRSVPGLRTLDE